MSTEPAKKWIILIIDDDPDFCTLLETALPKEFQVVMSHSGEEGIEEAAKRRHDLILLDVMMPGIHGFHTLERLKNDPMVKETPIIVTSNLPQDEVEIKVNDAGAHYLNKQSPIKAVVANICKIVSAASR